MAKQYQPIGGGYQLGALRVGMTVINPAGREVYIQPGDAETAMMANIDALDEISDDVNDAQRAVIADMMLSEYFD